VGATCEKEGEFKVKNLWIPIIVLYLMCLGLSIACAAELHPKYGPKAIPLMRDNQYFRGAEAKDFWNLIPFYAPQTNEYSCSVASVAIVLNAMAKRRDGIPDTEMNITQDMLLDSVKDVPIRALVSKEGFWGRHGLSLEELRTVAEQAARAHGFQAIVTAYSFKNRSLDDLRAILRANEEDSMDFLMVHFIQDDLTGAQGGPYAHISPIGAYDGKSRRVLILDVDRDWYSPYWVQDEDLLAAMNHETKPLGVGGFVRVRFEAGPRKLF
jgi:hypothetical protein